jgi:ubiquinone/menaquinone biosynthesis C-methylase UbiE
MPSPQQQNVQDQFTRTAMAFSVYARRDSPEVLEERLEFVGLAPDDRVLDVACGPGAFVLAAATRIRFARGLDLTGEMLRQARRFRQESGVTNAGFDLGEGEHLPYAPATFDLVACQFAFHHLTDPQATLREMLRVAKPAGRIFVADSIGPEDKETSELHNAIERMRDPSHTTALSLSEIRCLFTHHGLRVIRESVRSRVRPFDDWMRRAGIERPDSRYDATRRAIEESIPADKAGFSARANGNDLTIVHQEGMFLLAWDAFERH